MIASLGIHIFMLTKLASQDSGVSMIDFKGKEILVVGGSSGIGFSTALIAASLGGQVTIASRTAAKVEAAAKKIGVGTAGCVLDVTSDAEVTNFFARTMWDHVIVTGSDVKIGPVRDLPFETAHASFDSKYWGFYRVARAANIRPGGSLGVIAGFLATRPAAGRALMGSITGAIESLVQGLALELKPVRVNAVSPGAVQTEMWDSLSAEAREGMFSKVAATYPAGCIGQPEYIAHQLLLLAATPYATGTIVTLDGGASIA
jgi:NAD(P)-dependent dehydrogenase (short-subunit alcohol dehydrogenase family)